MFSPVSSRARASSSDTAGRSWAALLPAPHDRPSCRGVIASQLSWHGSGMQTSLSFTFCCHAPVRTPGVFGVDTRPDSALLLVGRAPSFCQLLDDLEHLPFHYERNGLDEVRAAHQFRSEPIAVLVASAGEHSRRAVGLLDQQERPAA